MLGLEAVNVYVAAEVNAQSSEQIRQTHSVYGVVGINDDEIESLIGSVLTKVIVNVMSSSDPYKSRMVRGVVRQVQRLLDRSQTTVRRVQVAASWSAQILLYPVYALFQTGRLLSQTLERSQDEARLQLELEVERYDIPLTVEAAPLTAETALHNVLQTLQAFDLPSNCTVQFQAPETIRAIASQLDSHDLVLVTNYNQLLALPDPAQQAWLQQRLVYEIASYNQQYRTRSLPFQPVIRAFQGLAHTLRRRFSAPAPLPPSPTTQLLPPPTELTADLPIQRSLLTVRQWMTTTPVRLVQSEPGGRSLAATPPAALKAARIQIRGVASLLPTRQLVLISRTNDVVDILTPEQAALLQQRMAWETAHYQRYLRLQAEAATPLIPFQPPSANRFLLPPIRAFQRLMAWMQTTPVAQATNLFQEAVWFAGSLPAAEPPDTPPAIAPAPQVKPALPASRLPQPFQALRTAAAKRLNPASTALTQAASTGVIGTQSNQEAVGTFATANGDRPDLTPTPRSREYIDTDVTWFGYEQSWFERIMRWLDRLFLWIETRLSQIWKNWAGK